MQNLISAVCRNKFDEKGFPTTFKKWEKEPTMEDVMEAMQSAKQNTLYVLSKYGISCCSVKFYGSLEAAAKAVKDEALTAVDVRHPRWWRLVL